MTMNPKENEKKQMQKPYPTINYDAHSRTVPREDYWRQVCRTQNGEPVSEEQIKIIVNAVIAGLKLCKQDILLDLACGNGALSRMLFDFCSGLVGVDISPYLIEIANQDFLRAPDYTFIARGIYDYLETEAHPERFTKVLCYASIQYLSDPYLKEMLDILYKRFSKVSLVFIGNVPDKERAAFFYKNRIPSHEELTDPEARIGVWRTKKEIESLAEEAGWRIKFSSMPPDFYLSSHRYDVTLERGGKTWTR